MKLFKNETEALSALASQLESPVQNQLKKNKSKLLRIHKGEKISGVIYLKTWQKVKSYLIWNENHKEFSLASKDVKDIYVPHREYDLW